MRKRRVSDKRRRAIQKDKGRFRQRCDRNDGRPGGRWAGGRFSRKRGGTAVGGGGKGGQGTRCGVQIAAEFSTWATPTPARAGHEDTASLAAGIVRGGPVPQARASLPTGCPPAAVRFHSPALGRSNLASSATPPVVGLSAALRLRLLAHPCSPATTSYRREHSWAPPASTWSTPSRVGPYGSARATARAASPTRAPSFSFTRLDGADWKNPLPLSPVNR